MLNKFLISPRCAPRRLQTENAQGCSFNCFPAGALCACRLKLSSGLWFSISPRSGCALQTENAQGCYFSAPPSKRAMFALCLPITNIPTAKAAKKKSSYHQIADAITVAIIETIADRDEILNMRKTAIQTPSASTPVSGFNASKPPNIVATPFPPRKLSQMEKQWPITTAMNAKSAIPKCAPIFTARTPFAKSRRKLMMPSFLPAMRIMFVAPGFPLPC